MELGGRRMYIYIYIHVKGSRVLSISVFETKVEKERSKVDTEISHSLSFQVEWSFTLFALF